MRCDEKKIVFEDQNKIKVIRGLILYEDEHTYKILTSFDKKEFIIGKRYIIKISDINRGDC